MRLHVLPAIVGAALAFGACSKDDAQARGDGGGDAPSPYEPTFTNVFRGVILGNGCALTQCHGASNAGSLRLDGKQIAFDGLVGKKAAGPCVTDAGSDGAATDAGPDPGANQNICGCAPSGKTRVVAGKPEESLLIEKLSATETCGERMPPTGEPIAQEQLDMVKQWIAAGASYD